jgi:hypothetical protein
VLELTESKTEYTSKAIRWNTFNFDRLNDQKIKSWHPSQVAVSNTCKIFSNNYIFDNEIDLVLDYHVLLISSTFYIPNTVVLIITVVKYANQPKSKSLNKNGANNSLWEKRIGDDDIHKSLKFDKFKVGKNKIYIFHTNPAIILQKCVLSNDNKMNSYLEPFILNP